MATAARRSANFNDLYSSSIEKWMGSGKVEEVIFSANQLVWLLSKIAKEVGKYGFEVVQPLMTTRNTGIGWFQYDDTLSIASFAGPEAAKFDMAFLGGPLVITEQEEIENAEPYQMVNRLKFKFDQLMLSLAEEVNVAGFKGSGVNTKSIDGLEDIVVADDDSGTTPNLTRAQATRANNIYGGIQRVAGGSTGWENYSIDLTTGSAATNSFASFTATAYQCLELLYAFCSRGAIRPDIILSSLTPYLDYHRLATANATYWREIDTLKGINLGHDNTKYRNAVWLYDESATMHADAAHDAPTGSDAVYVLNSSYLKMHVETGYDFALTPFQTPVDARISIGHVLWRGQVLSPNPRYLGVLHGYGQ